MIQNFKEELFAKAKDFGFSECELFFETSKDFTVKIFQGKLNEYKNTEHMGLSFRGKYLNKMGYSYTERIDLDLIPMLLKNAADNASVIEEEEEEFLYPGDESYPALECYSQELEKVSVEEKIKTALEMEKKAYDCDPRVKTVDSCMLSTFASEVFIANTKGLNLSQTSNGAFAMVSVVATDGEQTKSEWELWIGRDLEELKAKNIGRKAAEKTLSYLGAKKITSRSCPVVLSNLAAVHMLSAFVSAFYAEGAQKGFSLLRGKEGQAIASKLLTIRDDGIYKDSLGNAAFDSEGVATKNKTIIEKGTLLTLLYNLKSAEKDKVKSTGNGFKASFRAAVSTSATNFYVEPSDLSLDAVLEKAQSAVYITKLSGLHAGTNAVSGDFSLSADGFLIEDGKITKPVEQITVAGNFFQLLKEIEAIGSDLNFLSHGSSFIGSPSLLIQKLSISGE